MLLLLLALSGPTVLMAADDLRFLGKGPAAHDNGQLLACTGTSASPAAVLCVRSGADAGGNGSAAAPFNSINDAIAAAKAGDVLQVAEGSYSENVSIGSFELPSAKHLSLLGGFSVDFSQRDAAIFHSLIDGGGLMPTVQLHLNSDHQTMLDGFRITNGLGLGSDWQDGFGHGGGVYVQLFGDGEVLISHNRIFANQSANATSADTRGGGLHSHTQNWGEAKGRVRVEDNIVSDNQAGKGAGINVSGRQATLLRNRVENNISHDDHGGGIYISTGETMVIDNVVRGNQVGATVGYGWGGGLIVAAAGAQLQGNVITDNSAPSAGSGVYWDEGAVGSMRNDLIFKNACPQSDRSAAAIYIDGGPGGPSLVTLENLTVADHDCPDSAPTGAAIVIEDESAVIIRNSILWGNTADLAVLAGGSFEISYSITSEAGIGNFSADPLFAEPAAHDYHLRSAAGRYANSIWVLDPITSPAVDAGDPAAEFGSETQPNGGRINLGSYGNTPEASRSPPQDSIFADRFQ